jgi:lauroyl/myristoyl acyltransferase
MSDDQETKDQAPATPGTPGAPGAPAAPTPIISGADIGNTIGLGVLAVLAWILPEGALPGFCRRFGGLNLKTLAGDEAALVGQIRGLLGGREAALAADAIPAAVAAEDLLATMQLLRAYRPGGWSPAIELKGAEHIEAAAGEGVILWVAHFVHGSLIAKMAGHRFGHSVSHLSHVRHGFSSTRYGLAFLNRVRTVAEDRYIEERIQRTDENPTVAMRRLVRKLAKKGMVSITVRDDTLRPETTPFLGGELTFAPGAPDLAHMTKSTLLPVFPVRQADGFALIVDPPISIDREVDRRAATAKALREYAGRLEAQVLKYPDQWLGWFHL